MMAMAEKIQKYGLMPPLASPAVMRTQNAAENSRAASRIPPPILASEVSRRDGNSSTVPTPATTQSAKITSGESGTLWANNGAETGDVSANMTNRFPDSNRAPKSMGRLGNHARPV